MFCDRCGTRLETGQRFCASCGKPAGTVPLMPVQSRISGHVRLLGILWIAISAFRLLPGIFLTTFLGHGAFSILPGDVPRFLPGLLGSIGTVLLVGAAFGIAAGWGLLERRPWARMMAIVLGCFSLVDMPFGTALGIYTMWVLLPARSEEEYRQISRAA
jgi:hypothetical protein